MNNSRDLNPRSTMQREPEGHNTACPDGQDGQRRRSESSMDEIVRQNRAGLAWLANNIAEYGGAAERIHITGHSSQRRERVVQQYERHPNLGKRWCQLAVVGFILVAPVVAVNEHNR